MRDGSEDNLQNVQQVNSFTYLNSILPFFSIQAHQFHLIYPKGGGEQFPLQDWKRAIILKVFDVCIGWRRPGEELEAQWWGPSMGSL